MSVKDDLRVMVRSALLEMSEAMPMRGETRTQVIDRAEELIVNGVMHYFFDHGKNGVVHYFFDQGKQDKLTSDDLDRSAGVGRIEGLAWAENTLLDKAGRLFLDSKDDQARHTRQAAQEVRLLRVRAEREQRERFGFDKQPPG